LQNRFQDNKISHIEGDDDDRKSAFAEVPLLETLALDGNEIRSETVSSDQPVNPIHLFIQSTG
jgi:hypothetical protein